MLKGDTYSVQHVQTYTMQKIRQYQTANVGHEYESSYFPAPVGYVTTNVCSVLCFGFFSLSLRHREVDCILSGAENITWELLKIRD